MLIILCSLTNTLVCLSLTFFYRNAPQQYATHKKILVINGQRSRSPRSERSNSHYLRLLRNQSSEKYETGAIGKLDEKSICSMPSVDLYDVGVMTQNDVKVE